MTNTKNKVFYTDYKTAATWGDASLVLCNKLPDIDNSIWDNARFNMYETDEEGNENDYPIDIYQYFITDLQDWQVEWQEKHFPDLKYTYSDLLDCWILCVDHCGTAWTSVPTETTKELIDVNPDIEYKGL